MKKENEARTKFCLKAKSVSIIVTSIIRIAVNNSNSIPVRVDFSNKIKANLYSPLIHQNTHISTPLPSLGNQQIDQK